MKFSHVRLGMRVRQVSTEREGTIVCVHFGVVEIDWGDGHITSVEQDDRGHLDLLPLPNVDG